MQSRIGVSRTKVGLFVAVVAILLGAAAYVVYAGFIAGSSTHAGFPNLVTVSGSIVAQPSGLGKLIITVKDSASAPIESIAVVNSSSLPISSGIQFYYNGAVVSDSNMLPVGYVATGSLDVQNVIVGQDYKFTMSTTVDNYGPEIQTLDMTAQS
ncbi:MAG: hypothetical protein ABSG45_00015 [Nitrososphaerales archaeon]|jgi:hypothetical protein